MLSETLRYELQPLGIRVITGMVGHVESNFHKNDTWPGLSESSHWKPFESFARSVNSGDMAPLESQEKFARNFVGDIVGGASGRVYRGKAAKASSWAAHFAPTFVLVSVPFLAGLRWRLERVTDPTDRHLGLCGTPDSWIA